MYLGYDSILPFKDYSVIGATYNTIITVPILYPVIPT